MIYGLTSQVLLLISTILWPGNVEVNLSTHRAFPSRGGRKVSIKVFSVIEDKILSRKRVAEEQSILSLND